MGSSLTLQLVLPKSCLVSSFSPLISLFAFLSFPGVNATLHVFNTEIQGDVNALNFTSVVLDNATIVGNLQSSGDISIYSGESLKISGVYYLFDSFVVTNMGFKRKLHSTPKQ